MEVFVWVFGPCPLPLGRLIIHWDWRYHHTACQRFLRTIQYTYFKYCMLTGANLVWQAILAMIYSIRRSYGSWYSCVSWWIFGQSKRNAIVASFIRVVNESVFRDCIVACVWSERAMKILSSKKLSFLSNCYIPPIYNMSLTLDFLLPPPPASYKADQASVVHGSLSGRLKLSREPVCMYWICL